MGKKECENAIEKGLALTLLFFIILIWCDERRLGNFFRHCHAPDSVCLFVEEVPGRGRTYREPTGLGSRAIERKRERWGERDVRYFFLLSL